MVWGSSHTKPIRRSVTAISFLEIDGYSVFLFLYNTVAILPSLCVDWGCGAPHSFELFTEECNPRYASRSRGAMVVVISLVR